MANNESGPYKSLICFFKVLKLKEKRKREREEMRLFFWRRKELQAEKSLTEQIEEAEDELKLVTQDMQNETISKGEIRSAILKFVVIMEIISLSYFCVVLMQSNIPTIEKFYSLIPFVVTPFA